jgi:hypothetical protein
MIVSLGCSNEFWTGRIAFFCAEEYACENGMAEFVGSFVCGFFEAVDMPSSISYPGQ